MQDQSINVWQDQCGNWFAVRPRSWAQDKIVNQVDVGRARRAADGLAMAQVSKENQIPCNPLSMLSTKKTQCDSISVHVQCCQPVFRAERDWA